MSSLARVALGLGLLVLSALPALTQTSKDWVDIKGENALRALYANKTHRARTFVTHNRADGQGIYVAKGSDVRVPRTWRVKGNDQVCLAPKDGDPLCFRYQQSTKNPAEIVAIGESRGQRVMFMFTVEDGIPKF